MMDKKYPGITEKLREQTRKLHIQAHKLPFFTALFRGELQIDSYIGQLRVLSIIHESLERETADMENKAVSAVLDGYMPKLPLLSADLEFFAHLNIRDIPPVSDAARAIADKIRKRKEEKPESLIAYLYTLEGSTMGGKVIKPHISKTFGLEEGKGLLFFNSYGENVQENWQGFLHRMENAVSEEMHDDIISASAELFTGLIHIYKMLHPLEN